VAVIQTILWAQWKSIRILRFGAGRKGALFHKKLRAQLGIIFFELFVLIHLS